MRAAVAAQSDFPAVLFVHTGAVSDGASFFAGAWPEASAIADPERKLYQAFGIERGGWSQMFSPGVMVCSLRATAKGHSQGMTVGDSWQMPGVFLVQGACILWQHDYAHVGDAPTWSQIPAIVKQVTVI